MIYRIHLNAQNTDGAGTDGAGGRAETGHTARQAMPEAVKGDRWFATQLDSRYRLVAEEPFPGEWGDLLTRLSSGDKT